MQINPPSAVVRFFAACSEKIVISACVPILSLLYIAPSECAASDINKIRPSLFCISDEGTNLFFTSGLSKMLMIE